MKELTVDEGTVVPRRPTNSPLALGGKMLARRLMVPLVYGIGFFAFYGPAFAQPNTQPIFHAQLVPGLSDIHCSSKNSNKSSNKCDSLIFQVQVIPILNESNAVGGCAAFFPYNSLTVHTSPKAETTTLTWAITPPSQGTATFDKGVLFSAGNGGSSANPFGSGGIALSNSNMTAKLTLNTQPSTSTEVYSHLPSVKLGSFPCLGGDPIITNSAD